MESSSYRRALPNTALAALTLAIGGGCMQQHAMKPWKNPDQVAMMDMQIVDAVRDSGIRSAIITQHTLYPYHFVENGDALNDLGQRDLEVLASHLRNYAGAVDVYRGSADATMYGARVRYVTQALRDRGVAADHVKMGEGQGGGAAMSEDVLRDVQIMRQDQMHPQQTERSITVTEQPSGGSSGGQQ